MVAITGCIGVGKTYISNIFEEFGIPVFNTDIAAKKVMVEDERVFCSFCDIFGSDIYKNGELDKKRLAEIIFSDEKKLQIVEGLVHPAVLKNFLDWKFKKIYKEKCPFVMMENAILTKGKTYKLFDHVVLVDASLKIRKKRIMSREGMTEKQMNEIIRHQDFTIDIHSKLTHAGINVFTLMNDEKYDIKPKVKLCVESLIDYFKEE